MKKLLPVLLCVPLLGLAAAEPQKSPNKIPQDARERVMGVKAVKHAMVAAERSFSEMSKNQGVKEAFSKYLADDSVIFRPGPVPGRNWFAEHDAGPGTLTWEPTYVEVAGSGELGVSTGPYLYESAAQEGQAPVVQHGHFVSIWEKKLLGWRVILDHGISHAKPKDKPEFELRVIPENKESGTWDEAPQQLFELDKLFSELKSEEALLEAYELHGAEDLRIYREGLPPVQGKKKALKQVAKLPILVDAEMAGAGTSRASDLAFSYGTGTVARLATSSKAAGSYLRVWRQVDKSWKLVLDLAVPYPQPRRKPPTPKEPAATKKPVAAKEEG